MALKKKAAKKVSKKSSVKKAAKKIVKKIAKKAIAIKVKKTAPKKIAKKAIKKLKLAMPMATAVEEQTEFTVILIKANSNKIGVIKAVREITGLGLKEAKDLVDVLPKPVKEGVAKADANAVYLKLQDAGATAKIV